MKTQVQHVLLICLLALTASGQVVFQYDQQSSDESRYLEGGAGLGYQPLGQSFTPTLSSVGFIRIYLVGGFGRTAVSRFILNVRSESITGPILGTSTTVSIYGSYGGPVDFFFSQPVAVIPGTTYFFQPVSLLSGGGWGTITGYYRYGGGELFANGNPYPLYDFWFREGIIVPEPSTGAFALLGGLTWLCLFGKRKGICGPRRRPLGEVRPAV